MFGEVKGGPGDKLVTGGIAGGRATWNFSEHLGLELSYNFMVNNVRLVTPIAPGLPSYNFGQQIYSRRVTAGPVTLSVREYAKPQISSVAAQPTSLSCALDKSGTHTASLTGQATGSACGGNLTYKWTVTEGSVTTITVNCPPQFKRLSDIVFSKNRARVNNCGKRILIDQAAPQAGTTYDVVLVGHRAADEETSSTGTARRRTRSNTAARPLDEQRALNAAAVLVGGHGTCANLDPSQVKVDWVATDSTSTPDPGLCGTSNLPSTKERRGSQVSQADKDRRVEVYLVPRNSQAMPPAVKNAKQLPETEIKSLGCPR
jgi:hypothetical protein